MANCVINNIVVYGDEDKIKSMYDFLIGLSAEKKKDYEENHEKDPAKYRFFSENKIEFCRIKEALDIPDGLDTRGFIDEIELSEDGTEIHFYSETAWSFNEDFMDAFVDNFDTDYAAFVDADDFKVVYNDPNKKFFDMDYILDVFEINPYEIETDTTFFSTISEWEDFINEHGLPESAKNLCIGISFNDYEDLEGLDDYMSFYVVDYDISSRASGRYDNYNKHIAGRIKEEAEMER